MILSVGCALTYQVLAPSAHFTLNILAARDAEQQVREETLVFAPVGPLEKTSTSKGNRVIRAEAPGGPFEIRYEALVEVTRPLLPVSVKPENPGHLPLAILTYMLPSRYCESDRFTQHAWDLFGRIENRAEQVREICLWVDANLTYTPGATDSRTSAWDVWQLRKGVCRDYTHLAIALCRALNIPARYVGGYALGLDPMDFHACFEAYIGGRWYLFDPTDQILPEHIAVIARGRDAANCALTTIFGRVHSSTVKVLCAATTLPATSVMPSVLNQPPPTLTPIVATPVVSQPSLTAPAPAPDLFTSNPPPGSTGALPNGSLVMPASLPGFSVPNPAPIWPLA